MSDHLVIDYAGRPAKLSDNRGDCVTRAIAIATEQPYLDVYAALIETAKGMRQTQRIRTSHPRTGVARPVYEKYLNSIGWEFVPTMRIGEGCKMHLRKDELPKGRIIARCSHHLVACIDGIIHDNHDPSRGGTRCVYGYFRKA